MTPEQALDILDQATAKFQGNRQDHILLSQALEAMKKMMEEHKALKDKKD